MGKELLSFSVDLCNSTYAKSVINRIVGRKTPRAEEYLYDYVKALLAVERDIYQCCIDKSFPLEKLYLVKPMGDEVWFVHEVSSEPEERTALMSKLFDILMYVASRPAELFIAQKDISWEEEEKAGPAIWEGVERIRIPLPRKVYADLLSDYASFSQYRQDMVVNLLVKSFGAVSHERRGELLTQILPRLSHALGLGELHMEPMKQWMFSVRFDPIGLDVDRFFRCAKHAVPSLLTVGQTMFETMFTRTSPTRCERRIHTGGGGKTEHFNCIEETLTPDMLKGIEAPYAIYTMVNRVYGPPMAINLSRPNEDGCDETRTLLLKHGFIRPPDAGVAFQVCQDRWTTRSSGD